MTAHYLDHAIDHTRERVTTVCTCGRWLVATPTPDQEPHVVGELGYADIWQACIAHDPMHSTVARALSIGESPTLLRLVHSDPAFASDALVAYEEAAVLACQTFHQAARKELRG